MTPRPSPAEKVVIYITHGSRLLVFRHTAFPEAGIQVPAGSIEPGETPEQAARREAQEESGLNGLELRHYLGMELFDLAAVGRQEQQRRHYFHVICSAQPPERWLSYELTPSDGSPAPIEFELYWVAFPGEVPELAGGQGAFLENLQNLVGSDAPGQA